MRHTRSSPRSLDGKVVAVTGGARGIGRATATALARRGATVAIGDLDQELAAKVADSLGGGAIGLSLDVTDLGGFTEFLDHCEGTLGALDVLVNNAGIMPLGLIEEEPTAVTERTVAINLLAVIHGTREAVKRMKPRGTGHIVNVASAAGKVAAAQLSTYTATKFGVVGFSDAVALELHGSGVELSVVMPSICRTDLATGLPEMRGFPWIEPDQVAARIVDALEAPRFEVPVPRSLGPILTGSQLLPFRARARLSRLTKTDRVISGRDRSARAEYEDRISRVR